ncbi:MAG: hypothetical protein JNL19_02530 [Burkholderiales bacterium]|nr:hypothetical protein [Burkholderiales bacterium]
MLMFRISGRSTHLLFRLPSRALTCFSVAVAVAIGLTGCASLSTPIPGPLHTTVPSAASSALRDSINTSGRFSASSAQGKASGQFQLIAARGAISLSLFSPLGTPLAEITARPANNNAAQAGLATARFSDGREVTAPRLTALLADVLPIDVPDAVLLAWLQGQPATADAPPGPVNVIREGDRGAVQAFTQAGWEVVISERWPEDGLPRRMRWSAMVSGESAELRWALDRWTAQ